MGGRNPEKIGLLKGGVVVADFGQSNFDQLIFGQPIGQPFLANISGQWLVVQPIWANPILANPFCDVLLLLLFLSVA